MQCTLLVPHLSWRRDAAAEAYRDLAAPALHTLLARARHESFSAIGWEAWLCQAFEVERQSDWPVAPLTLAIDGGDPGDAYWLRADPVHLRPHREQLLLADRHAFTLSNEETSALVAALNVHFGGDGLQFSAPHPERWYLRLEAAPGIHTHPLDDVAGMTVDPHLPAGANAVHWHGVINEIQMLLHAHPVNQAREARGEPPVNALWLWGGGRRVEVHGRHFSSVLSADPLAVALATHADIPTLALPEDARHALAPTPKTERRGGHVLVVLDQLIAPARRGDLAAWRGQIEALDRIWFKGLLDALKRGALEALTLVAPGAAACERFQAARADLFKFWRTRRPLADYLLKERP